MFGWFKQKFIAFLMGLLVSCCLFGYLHSLKEYEDLKERLPSISECDIQQLPPNSKNLRGLGNHWILFDMEVNGENKTFLFRRGCHGSSVFTQVK